jgi:hypothetical protein
MGQRRGGDKAVADAKRGDISVLAPNRREVMGKGMEKGASGTGEEEGEYRRARSGGSRRGWGTWARSGSLALPFTH